MLSNIEANTEAELKKVLLIIKKVSNQLVISCARLWRNHFIDNTNIIKGMLNNGNPVDTKVLVNTICKVVQDGRCK